MIKRNATLIALILLAGCSSGEKGKELSKEPRPAAYDREAAIRLYQNARQGQMARDAAGVKQPKVTFEGMLETPQERAHAKLREAAKIAQEHAKKSQDAPKR